MEQITFGIATATATATATEITTLLRAIKAQVQFDVTESYEKFTMVYLFESFDFNLFIMVITLLDQSMEQ